MYLQPTYAVLEQPIMDSCSNNIDAAHLLHGEAETCTKEEGKTVGRVPRKPLADGEQVPGRFPVARAVNYGFTSPVWLVCVIGRNTS